MKFCHVQELGEIKVLACTALLSGTEPHALELLCTCSGEQNIHKEFIQSLRLLSPSPQRVCAIAQKYLRIKGKLFSSCTNGSNVLTQTICLVCGMHPTSKILK